MSVVNNCKTFNEENTINEKCFINLLNTEFGNNNNNNISNNKQETRATPVWLTDENDESTSYSPIKNLAGKLYLYIYYIVTFCIYLFFIY